MKSRFIKILITSFFAALAAFGTAQWIGGNVAIQIGGSNNKIEQKLDYNYQSSASR
jgi:hypothetical protein